MYQTFYYSGSACNQNIVGWNTASVATVCQCQSWAAFPFLLAGIVQLSIGSAMPGRETAGP